MAATYTAPDRISLDFGRDDDWGQWEWREPIEIVPTFEDFAWFMSLAMEGIGNPAFTHSFVPGRQPTRVQRLARRWDAYCTERARRIRVAVAALRGSVWQDD